jgi:hypothetical protein
MQVDRMNTDALTGCIITRVDEIFQVSSVSDLNMKLTSTHSSSIMIVVVCYEYLSKVNEKHVHLTYFMFHS